MRWLVSVLLLLLVGRTTAEEHEVVQLWFSNTIEEDQSIYVTLYKIMGGEPNLKYGEHENNQKFMALLKPYEQAQILAHKGEMYMVYDDKHEKCLDYYVAGDVYEHNIEISRKSEQDMFMVSIRNLMLIDTHIFYKHTYKDVSWHFSETIPSGEEYRHVTYNGTMFLAKDHNLRKTGNNLQEYAIPSGTEVVISDKETARRVQTNKQGVPHVIVGSVEGTSSHRGTELPLLSFVIEDIQAKITRVQKAADAGDVSALIELGRMHEYGEGFSLNLEAASKLYSKALANGDESAHTHVSRVRKKKIEIKKSTEL